MQLRLKLLGVPRVTLSLLLELLDLRGRGGLNCRHVLLQLLLRRGGRLLLHLTDGRGHCVVLLLSSALELCGQVHDLLARAVELGARIDVVVDECPLQRHRL